MKTRQYIILGVVIGTVAVSVFVNSKFETVAKSRVQPISRAEYKIQTKVLEVKNASYPAKVSFTGRVRAIDRIDLFAEVSGILKKNKLRFKEGNKFRKGQVLVHLDDTEMRLQLTSRKSKFINTITKLIPDLRIDYAKEAQSWEDYLEKLNPQKRLPSLPKIESKKLVYFISGRNVNDAYYDIKSQEAKLAKFTIYAPFNGVVKKSSINPGTLVRSGQSLGEFISTDAYEMEASISFRDLKFIELGQEVVLRSNELEKDWVGNIYRMGNVINESTQTISVFIKIKSKTVKEGMYLKGNVDGKMITDAFAVPRLLLLPEDKLYAVSDSTLVALDVDVIKVNNDQVIVRGLKNGTSLVSKSLARATEGTKVEIMK